MRAAGRLSWSNLGMVRKERSSMILEADINDKEKYFEGVKEKPFEVSRPL